MSISAKKWVFAEKLTNKPKKDFFKIVDFTLPEVKDGELLVQAVYLSVDPYMAVSNFYDATGGIKIGETVPAGEQCAKVLKSKDSNFPEGSLVLVACGWVSHAVVPAAQCKKIPDFGEVSLSLSLGSVGMPGLTACLALFESAELKEGETVLISSASGAVGNVAGQLAKLKGCKVIGFAGDDEKVDWIKELGFDHAYNYKKVKLDETLKKAAPDGIDVYVDMVGGEWPITAFNHMKIGSRIVIVGQISIYNKEPSTLPALPYPFFDILMKGMKIHGFPNFNYKVETHDGHIKYLLNLVSEGKLKYKEVLYEGFEKQAEAFEALFDGSHFGKIIVKA